MSAASLGLSTASLVGTTAPGALPAAVADCREAKVRIMHLARCLKHRTEKGKHYGELTGKFVDVLHALLWLIHDGKSGQCNPSYQTIADKADCVPSTVRRGDQGDGACRAPLLG